MLEKTKNRARRRVSATAVASALFAAAAISGVATSAQAATKTWDLLSAGSNNGQINNGSGTWNSGGGATSNWTTNGGTSNTTWSSGDDAVFGGASSVGAAGTITLSGDQTINTLTFNAVPSGNWTFNAGGSEFLYNGGTTAAFTQNSAATVTINPNWDPSTDATLTLGGNGSGSVIINGNLLQKNDSHPLTLVKTGTSNFILNGAGNVSSATSSINGGTLTVNGTFGGTGALNVNSTGKLAGTGTVSKTVTLNSGSTISPAGDGSNSNIGTLTTGAQNWEGGSTYVWEIKNTATGAGTNYDTLSIGGQLQLNATSGNKMTIKVVSNGPVTNWSNAVWNWNIATYSSLGGTFSAAAFLLDVSDFVDDNPTANPANFSVSQSGSSIRVSYVPEPGAALLGTVGAAALLRRRRRH